MIIYYVGDRDPAGLEIEANLAHKLQAYSGRDDMTIKRLACTRAQVADLGLIGNPPKKKTWRHPTLGQQPVIGGAVEVEAIDAPILREVVEAALTSHLDSRELEVLLLVEEQERDLLLRMANGWGWPSDPHRVRANSRRAAQPGQEGSTRAGGGSGAMPQPRQPQRVVQASGDLRQARQGESRLLRGLQRRAGHTASARHDSRRPL